MRLVVVWHLANSHWSIDPLPTRFPQPCLHRQSILWSWVRCDVTRKGGQTCSRLQESDVTLLLSTSGQTLTNSHWALENVGRHPSFATPNYHLHSLLFHNSNVCSLVATVPCFPSGPFLHVSFIYVCPTRLPLSAPPVNEVPVAWPAQLLDSITSELQLETRGTRLCHSS